MFKTGEAETLQVLKDDHYKKEVRDYIDDMFGSGDQMNQHIATIMEKDI